MFLGYNCIQKCLSFYGGLKKFEVKAKKWWREEIEKRKIKSECYCRLDIFNKTFIVHISRVHGPWHITACRGAIRVLTEICLLPFRTARYLNFRSSWEKHWSVVHRYEEVQMLLNKNIHGCVLHGSFFVLLPLQSSPSPDGGGLVHVLFLISVPPPQVLSQGPGEPQGDQLPSSPV